MRGKILLLPLLSLLCAAATAATPTQQRDEALGARGEVYSAIAGRYGDLFPAGVVADADAPVLAVDVQRPDGSSSRLLVPGTEDTQIEGSPSLVYEATSSTLYLVWESKANPSQSRLNLVGLSTGGWSDVIEVSGSVEPLKGAPNVLATHDTFSVPALDKDHPAIRRDRTVLHVMWWEQGDRGEEVFYAPVILQNGHYLGWNPVIDLNQLDPNPPAAPAPDGTASPALYRSPGVEPGPDSQSVVVGFVNPRTERLLSLEVEVLPAPLSFLADDVAAFMQQIGYGSRGIQAFAGAVRGHMIEIGNRLNGAVVGYLADHVKQKIIETLTASPKTDLTTLISIVRGHMIEIGASLFSQGMSTAPEAQRVDVLEITQQAPSTPAAAAPGAGAAVLQARHDLRIGLVADRPAPAVGSGPTRIFLSEDGARGLVSWEQDGQVLYRESAEDGGWSDVLRLPPDIAQSEDRADEILRGRVRNR